MDSDETAARERLCLHFGAFLAQSNALITRTEARVALVEAKAKEDPPIEKCNWVVLRPSSSNRPRGSKKPRLS